MDDLINLEEPKDDILAQFDPLSSSSSSARSTPTPLSKLSIVPNHNNDSYPSNSNSVNGIIASSGDDTRMEPFYIPPRKSSIVQDGPPKAPRRRQSLATTRRRRKPVMDVDRRNRISSESGRNISYSSRLSELQEPDSPAAVLAFKVARLRISDKFRWTNQATNAGVVFAMESIPLKHISEIQINVSLMTDEKLPTFKYNIESSVHELRVKVRLELKKISDPLATQMFKLQVLPSKEFLKDAQRLNCLKVVRETIKIQGVLRLMILQERQIDYSLKRTEEDDDSCAIPPIDITHQLNTQTDLVKMSEIEVLVGQCMKKCEELQTTPLHDKTKYVNLTQVQQAVKLLIIRLNEVEIFPISNAFIHLAATVNSLTSDTEDLCLSINKLRDAIADLVNLFQISWTDFDKVSSNNYISTAMIYEPLSLQIISLHQVPEKFLQSLKMEYVWIAVSIVRGDRASCCRKMATGKARVARSLFPRVLWDQKLTLNVPINQLPLDATLMIEIYGTEVVRMSNTETTMERENELSTTKVPLFDFKRRLLSGQRLIRLEKVNEKLPQPIVYLEFPDYNIEFPDISTVSTNVQKEEPETTNWPYVQKLLSRSFDITQCSDEEKQMIWKHRSNAIECPETLPFILKCCENWNAETLSEISGLLSIWPTIPSLIALNLLTKEFNSVQSVRDFAIKCLRGATEDLLLSVLSQLVFMLEHEKPQDSMLASFLLEYSWSSIRFTFHLHCALVTASDHSTSPIFLVMRELLEWSAGKAVKEVLIKTRKVLVAIDHNAEAIKANRSNDIHHFENLWTHLNELRPFRLPEFPGVPLNGIAVSKCKTFASFTAPVRLTFQNTEGEHFTSIYKSGDDLRQDQLITSLFNAMEHCWLSKGLDLRMITFNVSPTGKNRGFIEMVQQAVTIREIQVGNGKGFFEERSLQTWLSSQRNDKFEMVDNFSRSCAAYAVATYILGLGDRHNDNIMITRRGHMFHIDFNKAFGHVQKLLGTVKRDRAPFVLSEDMVFVINHGDKTGRKFHRFVDRCTEAYNIVRQHWREILSLIRVSVPMNMTALKDKNELQLVYDNLAPSLDEYQAQEKFTQRIRQAGSSVSVKINFFMHTVAQWWSNGHDGVEPLPDAEKYTIKDVGRPIDFEVESFETRFFPEKTFVYRIRVRWPLRISYILRSWVEFLQLRTVIEKFQIQSGGEYCPVLEKLTNSSLEKETVAAARRNAIFDFLDFANSVAQVRDHAATITFLYEDENRSPIKSQNSLPSSSQNGRILIDLKAMGQHVLLFVEHCQDLPMVDGRAPDSYVKTYIIDEFGANIKISKQKTPREPGNHPFFKQVIEYSSSSHLSLQNLSQKSIEISVWNYSLSISNVMIGKLILPLNKSEKGWFPLQYPNSSAPP